MRVILLKNVNKLGKAGDIREVAEGYGRNFLIPNGLAKLATSSEIVRLQAMDEEIAKKVEIAKKKMQKLAKNLSGVEIKIPAKVGGGGKLYGSISEDQIATALKRKGFEVEAGQIKLDKPIKAVGGYEIVVKLGGGMETKILVRVVEEK